MEDMMNKWPVQDAKARCSKWLDACVNEGPQVITRRVAETAAGFYRRMETIE
jgi:hypothetical protein